MTRCIQCGRANLQSKRVQLQGTVRGEDYTIEMQGLECPRCGYTTVEGTAMPEYGRLLSDKYRARHGFLTSEEIRARRARLGMTQEKFAEHVEVGLASVKRWEMGKIQDRDSNERIIRKTTHQTGSMQAFTVNFGNLHGSTARYHWANSGAVAIGALVVPGKNTSLDILQYIEGVVRDKGTHFSLTGTPPGLELSSLRTIPPHLASLFLQSER